MARAWRERLRSALVGVLVAQSALVARCQRRVPPSFTNAPPSTHHSPTASASSGGAAGDVHRGDTHSARYADDRRADESVKQAVAGGASSGGGVVAILEPAGKVDCEHFFITLTRLQPEHNPVLIVFLDGTYVVTVQIPSKAKEYTLTLMPLPPGPHTVSLRARVEERDQVRIGEELATVAFVSGPAEGAYLLARVPPIAINPVAPHLQLLHAPAILQFGPPATAPYDPEMMLDWLGIKTNASADDCKVGGRYFAVQPSRYYACIHHRRLAWNTVPGAEIRGPMPVVDDEYQQLAAALNAALASDGSTFVAIELGAWYGPWAMRAAAAVRQRHPHVRIRLIGVDPSKEKVAQMEAHWLQNGIPPSDMHAIQAFVGGSSGVRDSVPVLSLADLLPMARGEPIDYLDLDVQSAELDVLAAPGAAALLRTSVRRIQVGTHSTEIHTRIKELLAQPYGGRGGGGFILEHELPYNPRSAECDYSVKASVQQDSSCLVSTPQGPVYVRDGVLALTNADPRVWPGSRVPASLW